jgi:hypothetical protein
MYRTMTLVATASMALLGASARAEKVNMSPADLQSTATHVVVGKVNAIYERTAVDGDWNYTHYVAEIRVDACKKGEGTKKGDLVYARYWRRSWQGKGRQPPSTSGHRGLPSTGETVRVYLARNAYDGFSSGNKDGGFNVIGANGFEKLTARPSK